MITCASCNNTSGAKNDSHLGLELEQHRAMTGGTVGPPVKSVIQMGDIRLTANMRCSTEGNFDLTIVGNGRATNPEHLKRSLQNMKDGEVAKFKISLPVPHPEKVNRAVLKSCYLAASLFIGYEWARASAPDFVRRASMGNVDSTHLESFAYRFPSFGVVLGDGFMIGILSEFDLIFLTFPVGSEPAYFRGAVLPLDDQSIDQYCQNAKLFRRALAIGSNTIEYRECYIVDSEYQITEMHNEST